MFLIFLAILQFRTIQRLFIDPQHIPKLQSHESSHKHIFQWSNDSSNLQSLLKPNYRFSANWRGQTQLAVNKGLNECLLPSTGSAHIDAFDHPTEEVRSQIELHVSIFVHSFIKRIIIQATSIQLPIDRASETGLTSVRWIRTPGQRSVLDQCCQTKWNEISNCK